MSIAAHMEMHAPRLVSAPLLAALAPSGLAFARALENPRAAQERAFARLRSVVPTLFRMRGLEELRTLPLLRWDDIANEMDAVVRGEHTRVSRSPLVRFERSGGSSGAQKLVPMTRASLAEMNRALLPWLFSLYACAPGVARGSAYWSISPMGQGARATSAGVRIGAVDDASYFPRALHGVLRVLLAAPAALGTFSSVEACRYATLRALIERRDLSLISVWSPTFLTHLMHALDAHLDRLLFDLENGSCTLPPADHAAAPPEDTARAQAIRWRAWPARAAALRASAREAPLSSAELWPRLALLSMWTSASAAPFVQEARTRFPRVLLQPKGLLATEGVVSLPWPGAPAPVLAVCSHVMEFLDENGRAHFVDEVELGRSYEVVLTTGAGLVRYRLGDRVTVVGRVGATPCIRFDGRADQVSDVVGEKLALSYVEGVLARHAPHARFAMLAPRRAHPAPHYRLYLESTESTESASAVQLQRALEDALSQTHPYRYARALGQLGPLDVVRVQDGAQRYERACVRRGQRAGDVKPTALHRALDWDDAFIDTPAEADA